MTLKNSKAPVAPGACQCDVPCIECKCNSTIDALSDQFIPCIPGNLTIFLKRYKSALLLLSCNNHISRLVDAADILLDEIGRC